MKYDLLFSDIVAFIAGVFGLLAASLVVQKTLLEFTANNIAIGASMGLLAICLLLLSRRFLMRKPYQEMLEYAFPKWKRIPFVLFSLLWFIGAVLAMSGAQPYDLFGLPVYAPWLFSNNAYLVLFLAFFLVFVFPGFAFTPYRKEVEKPVEDADVATLPTERHVARDIEPVDFRGNAKEWFGIWIVNLLLSIVTLGIYSAWAKVRAKKYFYNNTYLAGRNFDYHATGMQILIGRLIVAIAFVVFQITASTSPILALCLVIGGVLIFPALIVFSMQFNARMSSYSNVRFGFDGTIGKAFLVFLLYPILMALTAYLTFPIWDRAVKRFSTENHRLGQSRFKFHAGLGAFYRAALLALVWAAVVGVAGIALSGFDFLEFASALENAESDPAGLVTAMGFFYLLFFAAFLPASFIYKALIRNAVFNSTVLEGGHRFYSNVNALALLWVSVSNMIIVVSTFFLMLPWAQVRLMRYLARHTAVLPAHSLDDFVQQQQSRGSATGDAFTDFQGIGIGLPA